MTCRQIVELVSEYLEDRMTAEDRARMEAHLADCDYCRLYVEQMRTTIRTLGRIEPEETMSQQTRAALMAAFRDWRPPLPGPSG
jgi:predicted anti-sigma-YlaC factor YlaD